MTEESNKSKKSWAARHKGLTGFAVLIVFGVIIASTSHGGVNNTPAVTGTAASTASAPAKQTAKVGDTINIGGDKGVGVTLSQIIDPAQSDSQYISPDAGKRFVGVKLAVTNKGTASFQDNANTDVTFIGSDNQSYTAAFSTITGCTNFSSGQFTLAAGASATGCVVFQVPNGVTASKVQFAPNSGFSGDTGEWTAQ